MTIENPGFQGVGGATVFPDGTRLLLQANEPGKTLRLYVQDLPSGKPRPITDKAYGFGGRPISPDGSWIAAYGDYSDDIFLLPAAGGVPRTIPNTKDLDLIRWTPDGMFLFAGVSGSIPARIVRIDVATGRREPWKELAPPELAGVIEVGPAWMTPDGKAYVYGYGRAATSDLYLIEGLR